MQSCRCIDRFTSHQTRIGTDQWGEVRERRLSGYRYRPPPAGNGIRWDAPPTSNPEPPGTFCKGASPSPGRAERSRGSGRQQWAGPGSRLLPGHGAVLRAPATLRTGTAGNTGHSRERSGRAGRAPGTRTPPGLPVLPTLAQITRVSSIQLKAGELFPAGGRRPQLRLFHASLQSNLLLRRLCSSLLRNCTKRRGKKKSPRC